MDRQIIHNMVEYINLQPEFPFDVIDVEESVGDVLAFYGLYPDLRFEERKEVKRELLKKALSAELAEMSRLAEPGTDCNLIPVMARLRPYRYGVYAKPSVPPREFVQKLHDA